MSKKLEGKVAIITGGNSGMGLATARRFVAEGAHVYITGRRQKELNQAAEAIGTNVTAIRGDVANLADLDRLYEVVRHNHGHVDVVFANAGIGELVPIADVTEEHFDRLFDVNVKGLVFTVQKALALMPDGGSIILNASIASIKGFESFSVYSATKAAVRSFARTWTADLKARRIRVNALSPGTIDTPILDALGNTKEEADQAKAGFVKLIPLGRTGTAEEIAKVALFLASDDSSFITGVELFVDGGAAQI
jgi:NAD(P)-dependent dehydrogenase (short-subunit alcohol dehydrogenase family)